MATSLYCDTGGPPHPPRPPSPIVSNHPPPTSAATSPWAEGSNGGSKPYSGRSYEQIIAQSSTSNILIRFKMTKIYKPENPEYKPPQMFPSHFGVFLFDVLKINPEDCLEIDVDTGRYDTKELLVKASTNLDKILSSEPHIYREHRIMPSRVSSLTTKVHFKNVPISVPDEEILHMCCHYGKLTDSKVHREVVHLGGSTKHSLPSSTRWVEMTLDPGKSFKNYYWLQGPQAGDTGRRITVLHASQPKQCSWCLRFPSPSSSTSTATNFCPGGGNGKMCQVKETPRAKMAEYVEILKAEGYMSLRDEYFAKKAAEKAAFPALECSAANEVSGILEAGLLSHLSQQAEEEEGVDNNHPQSQLPAVSIPESLASTEPVLSIPYQPQVTVSSSISSSTSTSPSSASPITSTLTPISVSSTMPTPHPPVSSSVPTSPPPVSSTSTSSMSPITPTLPPTSGPLFPPTSPLPVSVPPAPLFISPTGKLNKLKSYNKSKTAKESPLIQHISNGGDLPDGPVNAFVKWAVSNGKISMERENNAKCSLFLEGCIEVAGSNVEKLERLARLERRVREKLPNIQELHMSKLEASKSKSGKSRPFSQTGFDDKKEGEDTGLKTPRITSPEKV